MSQPASDAELDVLKVLWERGPGTVREVEAILRRRKRKWAYNTVLTLLTRLRDKGYVASDRGDREMGKGAQAYIFRATVSRDQLLRRRLADLADNVCDGTAS